MILDYVITDIRSLCAVGQTSKLFRELAVLQYVRFASEALSLYRSTEKIMPQSVYLATIHGAWWLEKVENSQRSRNIYSEAVELGRNRFNRDKDCGSVFSFVYESPPPHQHSPDSRIILVALPIQVLPSLDLITRIAINPLERFSAEQLPSRLQAMSNLREIFVECFWSLIGLPQTIGLLPFVTCVMFRTPKFFDPNFGHEPYSNLVQTLEISHIRGLPMPPQLLAQFELVGNFERLENLEMSCTDFPGLPETISNCTELRSLSIDRCPRLITLPSTICQCTKLTNITIERCGLIALPDDIGKLTALEQLDLTRNQLRTLPQSIGRCVKLIHIGLHDNPLESLPKSLTMCSRLARAGLYFYCDPPAISGYELARFGLCLDLNHQNFVPYAFYCLSEGAGTNSARVPVNQTGGEDFSSMINQYSSRLSYSDHKRDVPIESKLLRMRFLYDLAMSFPATEPH